MKNFIKRLFNKEEDVIIDIPGTHHHLSPFGWKVKPIPKLGCSENRAEYLGLGELIAYDLKLVKGKHYIYKLVGLDGVYKTTSDNYNLNFRQVDVKNEK